MKIRQDAFRLPVGEGECFCLYRAPADRAPAAAVLHLPAIGDEMNKARAMTAQAARAFAAHGCAVLQIDWIGCGDSSGEHAQTHPLLWLENATRALEWMRREHGDNATEWLWCLRGGALLAPALLEHAAPGASLLLWQPVLSGAQHLNHMLRLKLAGTLIDARDNRSSTKVLRERLLAGEMLSVGGYEISPCFARELEAMTFQIPSGHRSRVVWFELSASAPASLSPAAAANIDGARAAGTEIISCALQGPGFWQSVEIEHCEALIAESIAAFALDLTGAVSRNAVVL